MFKQNKWNNNYMFGLLVYKKKDKNKFLDYINTVKKKI